MPIFSCDGLPLYVDHLGRKIYADFEGKGYLRDWQKLTQCIESPSIFNGDFDEYCLVFDPPSQLNCIVINDCKDDIHESKQIQASLIRGSGILTGFAAEKTVEIWIDHSKTAYGQMFGSQNELKIKFNSELIISGANSIQVGNYSEQSWKKTDFIDVCEITSRQAHDLVVQNESETYEIDSQFDRKKFKGRHRSHLNRMKFNANISQANNGVVLRKLYDRFHGRQRARVLVNNQEIGYWYLPKENRKLRWAESDFFIPASVSNGRGAIEITIDPAAGSPLWSVSHYEVFSIPSK